MFKSQFESYHGLDDAIKLTSKLFNEKWSTGYDYNNTQPVTFTGKRLEFAHHPFFQKNLYYITSLFSYVSLDDDDGEDLPQLAKKETMEWENNGGQCIYLSVLLYSLLIHDKVFHETQINYCQGLYRHECRRDNPMGLLFGETHTGVHAWIEADDSVVDISIAQESDFFDFKEQPAIIGEVPEGIELIGFRETRKTVKGYARQIAKKSQMKYAEWLKYHSLSATTSFLEYHRRRKNDNFGQ